MQLYRFLTTDTIFYFVIFRMIQMKILTFENFKTLEEFEARMIWRKRFVNFIYSTIFGCYVLQIIVLSIYVKRDANKQNPVKGDHDSLWIWYYGSNFFCFSIEFLMICLFYQNFVKFSKELSKDINNINVTFARILAIIICFLLTICKVKSHIAMPIIVDIYYYKGDVIWSFITDSMQNCTRFLAIYDWIWGVLQFETFIVGTLILYMSVFMTSIQVNRQIAEEIGEPSSDRKSSISRLRSTLSPLNAKNSISNLEEF